MDMLGQRKFDDKSNSKRRGKQEKDKKGEILREKERWFGGLGEA